MRTFKNNVCNFIFSRSRLITAFSLIILVLALVNIVLQLMSSFRYVPHTVQVDESHERSSRLLKNVGNVYERKPDNEVGTTTSLSNGSTYHRYQKTLPKCQVVHIGIVCAGSKSNLFLHSMLKSMYFYRTSPLHFHIVTTDDSREVLELLFNTWNVPEVAVSFYDADDHLSEVSWISNTHYSGVYGLLKLIIPKIIQHTVTKRIIVIDTDLIFLDDIAKLWKLFDSFNHSQAIGVVENQSNYYLQRTYPVIGAGYNTGVILFQLDKLEKQYDWSRLWVRITRRLSLTHGTMHCGDQDIINAVIVEHPEILLNLPCQWNIQLSTNTFSADCYENRDIKVVHWNSPQKLNVENRDKDYFRAIYQTFLEYNGNLLKRQLFYCTTKREQKQLYVFSENETEGCSNFWWSQNHTWRTLLFITEYKYTALFNDVTYVVQLSFDRLQMIEELSKQWKGPISIVLYITDSDLQRCIDFIQNSIHLKDRTDIAYHAVFKEGDYYPINVLRNVAMRYVNTPYIFLADIDFVPMVSLYENIKTHICNMGSMIKKALIVPAFETQRYRSKLPKNKKELIKMLGSKSLSTFRYDVWPSGQIVTNYTKWANAKVPYEVKWQPDFEPYVVVQKDVVEYDKRFVGFGWNKVSHIMELEALGYKFIVLPNAFTIHKPHAPSDSIKKFRSSYAYRKCLDDLKKQFVEELYKRYGRQFHSPTVQML